MLLNQSVSNLISAHHRKVLSLLRPFKIMGFFGACEREGAQKLFCGCRMMDAGFLGASRVFLSGFCVLICKEWVWKRV